LVGSCSIVDFTTVSENRPFLEVSGFCPVCETAAIFRSDSEWLRDFFLCQICYSLPRERSLFYVLNLLYPNWRTLKIHESSPVARGASLKLKQECANYTPTQFDPNVPFGKLNPDATYRSEDLEHQTFADETFDLVVTQDVFEHLFRPDLAAQEIARTLRLGGAHILTVPMVQKNRPSRRRAVRKGGEIINLLPAEYHGNPMDPSGSLVTFDWGYDFSEYISAHSGLSVTIFSLDILEYGLRASFLEVVVCRKITPPDL
jgi:SAM-dependent methyltransferase